MRRIALLLAAAMLTLVAAPAAQAQDPYAEIPNVVGVSCTVTADSTPTAPGRVVCTGTGLQPGTPFSITIGWQRFVGTAFKVLVPADGAVAFVGAQSDALTTTINGTVDSNGRADGGGVIPAGADSSKPASITLTGTAKDGSAAIAAAVVNAEATDGTDGGAGAPTTPATGADSGTLALVAAGALVLGAGALVATRRRKTEMVA